MIWVEQPVGVGYTQGSPNITNEVELAQEFLGFYKQFISAFRLQNWSTYVTGESYTGFFVPYIADAFIQASASDPKFYNLKGIAISDPIIGDSVTQQAISIPAFARYWQNLFFLGDSFMEDLNSLDQNCSYTAYLDKYLSFPPPGPLPQLQASSSCDFFEAVIAAAQAINLCISVYHISDMCPFKWTVLGKLNPGDYMPPRRSRLLQSHRRQASAARSAGRKLAVV